MKKTIINTFIAAILLLSASAALASQFFIKNDLSEETKVTINDTEYAVSSGQSKILKLPSLCANFHNVYSGSTITIKSGKDCGITFKSSHDILLPCGLCSPSEIKAAAAPPRCT